MVGSSILIDRPLNDVWDYFTNNRNWIKWYGGELTQVAPGWQNGGKLVWAMGRPSTIQKIVPCQEIQVDGAWMTTVYQFKAQGKSATLMEIESVPTGGATFSDGGAAHKIQLDKDLRKLKEFVEKESGPQSI